MKKGVFNCQSNVSIRQQVNPIQLIKKTNINRFRTPSDDRGTIWPEIETSEDEFEEEEEEEATISLITFGVLNWIDKF